MPTELLGGTLTPHWLAPNPLPSLPQALRQFQFRVGEPNFLSVHVSLVPILGVVGEQKTKPTQHSVAVLRSLGINPRMIACRCSEPLDHSVRSKLVRRPSPLLASSSCCKQPQAVLTAARAPTCGCSAPWPCAIYL